MRWTSKSRDVYTWHAWWAWHPVCVSDIRGNDGYYHSSWAWGVTVLRKYDRGWEYQW